MDRFDEAAGVFLTQRDPCYTKVLLYPWLNHYVTNGTLVNNNNNYLGAEGSPEGDQEGRRLPRQPEVQGMSFDFINIFKRL